jgi:hypothetical protein
MTQFDLPQTLWAPPALIPLLPRALRSPAVACTDPLGAALDRMLALPAGAALPDSRAALQAALPSQGRVLVLWPDPAQAVAAALAQSPPADLGRTLAVWAAVMGALLDLWGAERRRLMLWSAADAAEMPGALAGLLGLAEPVEPPADTSDPPRFRLAPAPAWLAATTALQVSPALRALAGRAEAASLPRSPDLPAPGSPDQLTRAVAALAEEPDRLRRAHAQDLRRQAMQAEADQQEARARTDLLAAALAQATAETQAAIRAAADLDQGLRAEIASLTATLGQVRSQAEADGAARDAARDAALAQATAETQAAIRAAADLDQGLRAEIASLTAALGQVRSQAEAHDAARDAALAEMLAALRAGQAADLAQAEAALTEARTEAQGHLAEIGRLARDIGQRDQRIGTLAQSLRAAEDEVAALRNSTSWRLTAPLRGVSLGLRRLGRGR